VGANTVGRNILLAILVGVAVWSIAFLSRFWPMFFHPIRILLACILGALVVLVIIFWSKKFLSTASLLVLLALGSAISLLPFLILPTGCIQVRVTCSSQPPTANPDLVTAYTGDVICWFPSSIGYTVEFKEINLGDPQNPPGRRSPVRNSAGAQEISIRVLTSASQSRTVDVAKGYYLYNITCDNGNHVDPKVRVPPR
jgi:hypothetical protein